MSTVPRSAPTLRYPADLPITAHRQELLDALAGHQVVIVAGETGSGKSTQLPKLLLEAGFGATRLIGHTQPRRVAARTIAERVASELGTPLGDTVGYTVRFTDTVSPRTMVKVMTDGVLLAEIQRDRQLRAYDAIVLDEAHERSLNIDFLLGYLTHLLPQRPDLRLVVTSATLDTEHFAAHFGGAPVVAVSGRTYPVEVRYRPYGTEPGDDRDQVGAIADAVAELWSGPPPAGGHGDVLVFCSGEREIHDAADHLRRLDLPRTRVLPLYARMSAAEQHRVFEPPPAGQRRVILATNVAETSITVPGVRAVVDTGTARISRYSRRLKVQRLPIEPVSQASANQRAGRCGRIGPGVCIRLYAETDFGTRQPFTEPEILRTSLASVILQMAALGLGDVERFPFVDPPDPRSVSDGIALLEELGALYRADSGGLRLTKLGRRLARLPVDPRLGRMILEAQRLGCAREVTVIAAALSIQDPRERPAEHAEAAAQAHARFRSDDRSDLMTLVRLWDHLRARQRELSGNQFRRLCRDEYLNYLRVREWQDLFSQLRQVAGTLDIHLDHAAAHPDHVHQAVLAGLLSHIGMLDDHGDAAGRRGAATFLGARGARFTIARESVQANRPARWVMAAELVETDRIRARMVAPIRPEWTERVGAHLVKRTYGEPRWDAANGQAVVTERVTLYGLPVVAGRRVLLGRIDPSGARELFIRHALVEREADEAWLDAHAFLAHNRLVLDELDALAQRTRRPELAPDLERLVEFYATRLPQGIVSTRHFDRWWREARTGDPHLLDLHRDDLTSDPAVAVDEFPEHWVDHEPPLPLAYEYAPGEERDGLIVTVPLTVLHQTDPTEFGWLVPGLREELVATSIRSLPKAQRRLLVPAAEHVRLATMRLRDGPWPGGPLDFRAALAETLSLQCGERIEPSAFDAAALPLHLRMTFRVVDEDGNELACDRDLHALQEQLRPAVRAAVVRATGFVEHERVTDWTFGPLPDAIATDRDGASVRAYPALLDAGDHAQVRVLTSPDTAARATRRGVRRLLLLTLPLPRRRCATVLTNDARLALARLGWRSAVDLVDDCVLAAVDHLMERHGTVPRDELGFRALQHDVGEALADLAVSLTRDAAAICTRAAALLTRTETMRSAAVQPSVAEVRRQVTALVHPGFVSETGVARLAHLPRYLDAAAHRLDRLPDRLARDREASRTVAVLEAELAAHRGRPGDPDLGHVRWLIEELRVSLFAQHLGTSEPVSARRVRAALDAVAP